MNVHLLSMEFQPHFVLLLFAIELNFSQIIKIVRIFMDISYSALPSKWQFHCVFDFLFR